MNAISVIVPYKWNGMWVFDDPDVELYREPFVAGMDKMIDRVVSTFKEPEHGFICIFSRHEFPDHQFKLELTREESGGAWYEERSLNMSGWLCPALLKYFDTLPRRIYIKLADAHPKERTDDETLRNVSSVSD